VLEDTKGVIGIRKSKNRQHNGQKKKDKMTNNDLQKHIHKTKDRVTRTPLLLHTNYINRFVIFTTQLFVQCIC